MSTEVTFRSLRRTLARSAQRQKRELERNAEQQDSLFPGRLALGAFLTSIGWTSAAALTQSWEGLTAGLIMVSVFVGNFFVVGVVWLFMVLFIFRNKGRNFRERTSWLASLVLMAAVWTLAMDPSWLGWAVAGGSSLFAVWLGGEDKMRLLEAEIAAENAVEQRIEGAFGFSEAICKRVAALPAELPKQVEALLDGALQDAAVLRELLDDMDTEGSTLVDPRTLLEASESTLMALLHRVPGHLKLAALAAKRSDDEQTQTSASMSFSKLEKLTQNLAKAVAGATRYLASEAEADATELAEQIENLNLLAEAREEVGAESEIDAMAALEAELAALESV